MLKYETTHYSLLFLVLYLCEPGETGHTNSKLADEYEDEGTSIKTPDGFRDLEAWYYVDDVLNEPEAYIPKLQGMGPQVDLHSPERIKQLGIEGYARPNAGLMVECLRSLNDKKTDQEDERHGWVEGPLIDAYMYLMRGKYQDIKRKKIGLMMSGDNTISNGYQKPLLPKGETIFDKSVLYAPGHLNDDHWVLFKIDVKGQTLFIYDSMDDNPATSKAKLEYRDRIL
ncbi:hypothetical protein Ddc_17911 [Ditylenchus destructor]|nr:hypothetical protein Ddc_17911 [Ditylenchus destructor]